MELQEGGRPVIYTCYCLFYEFTQLSQENCKVAHTKVNGTGTNKYPCAQHEGMWGGGYYLLNIGTWLRWVVTLTNGETASGTV
jgi:hypothetical protein